MQDSTLKTFKIIKLGSNMQVPVHFQDKSSVGSKVEVCGSMNFQLLG